MPDLQFALWDWVLGRSLKYADTALNRCGNSGGSCLRTVTLTPDRIANELLQETLLTLDQVTTGITVLALNASMNPEQCPRIRVLLETLLVAIQGCETDLGTYAPLDAP